MNEDIRFSRSDYWGKGHYLVRFSGGTGRVSRAEDSTWSAFDWVYPVEGFEPRPALAEGLTNRRDAAIVLRTVCQVADKMEAETNELIRELQAKRCPH